jgi:peptide chain release factor 2
LSSIEAVVDPDRKRTEIAELEQQVAAPDLWDNQDNAQRVTSRLSTLQAEVDRLVGLRAQLEDIGALVELGQEEGDAASLAEAAEALTALQQAVEVLEVRTLLSGEYDERDALVTIRSEAGGVDAADFAAMLLRMYLRWAERHRYPTEVYDTSYAEEAGIKSATFQVKAPFAYGTLSVSKAPSAGSDLAFRQPGTPTTSFAGVEVLPVTESS